MSLTLLLGYLCCALGVLLGIGISLWLAWDWDLALLSSGLILLGLRLLDPGEDDSVLHELMDSSIKKLRD